MKKNLGRGSLLKSDGKTLCEVGYGEKFSKSYSVKDIKGKGLDKFRNNFNIIYYESGICVSLTVKRRRFLGESKILVYDFVNREFREKRIVEFLATKKYSLNKNGQLHIKNREISIDFADGKRKSLKYKSFGEDKIKFIGDITNNLHCSIVVANQFKDGFDYSSNSLGYSFRGACTYGDYKTTLHGGDEILVAYNACLATTKATKNANKIFGVGKCGEKDVLMILDTLSVENCANSSVVVYDGYKYKLGGMSAIIKSDEGYKFIGSDGSFSIKFEPHITHFKDLTNNKGIEFGKISGVITLTNGERIELENIRGLIAYNGRVM